MTPEKSAGISIIIQIGMFMVILINSDKLTRTKKTQKIQNNTKNEIKNRNRVKSFMGTFLICKFFILLGDEWKIYDRENWFINIRD